MSIPGEGVITRFRGSRTAALVGIGLLALLLRIPVAMIGDLIHERQERRDAAVKEVGAKWGRAQSISGPVLVVPYTYHSQEKTGGAQQMEKTVVRTAILLPDRLAIQGNVIAETRSRGIFAVPVYQLALDVAGEFDADDMRATGIPDADIQWDAAEFVIGLSDVRAIQRQPDLAWGKARARFLPGPPVLPGVASGASAAILKTGIRAPVSIAPGASKTAFRVPLVVNGSSELSFVPFGRETQVALQGDTDGVSFQGNWLPADRELGDGAFRARWNIPYLGRGYPQVWFPDADARPDEAIEASRFGAAFVPSLDAYRMADRSVKYAFLFIVLTFTAVWVLEVLGTARVHPIQYLLLGAAMCLFYLLELSLAEQIGFPLAYATASVAIVGMIGAYGYAVLASVARALGVAGGIAALYAYLYALLANEDYALLLGSIGLFVVLGAIMFATRRVDWYAVGQGRKAAAA